MKKRIIKILTKHSIPGGKCWKPFLMEEDYKKTAKEIISCFDTLIERCAELEKELKITDGLLTERQRVLDAIPECKAHGRNCVPNALEWIAKQLHESST